MFREIERRTERSEGGGGQTSSRHSGTRVEADSRHPLQLPLDIFRKIDYNGALPPQGGFNYD